MKKKLIGFMDRFKLFLVAPLNVLAFYNGSSTNTGSGFQGEKPTLPTGIISTPQVSIKTVSGVLSSLCIVFAWAFYLLIVLACVFGVVAAYRYLTSSGDAEKVKKATNTILYAAIAVAIALLARAIPTIVGSFLTGSGTNLGAC